MDWWVWIGVEMPDLGSGKGRTPMADVSRVLAWAVSVWYDGASYVGMGSTFSYTS